MTVSPVLVLVDHLLEQRVALVDEVVTQQHGEGGIADVVLGAEHCVTEALGLSLADEVDVGEVG